MLTRRNFLVQSSSCAAHLALAAAVTLPVRRARWAQNPIGRVVAREAFGTLEQIADGMWALVSDPLGGDRTTLANGGLIAGSAHVLAIEGFYQPAGATWLAGKARELTGRWPTHVALTHYHSDHANGVAGYASGAPAPVLHATARTRDDVVERNRPEDAARSAALADAVLLADTAPMTLDLGGRAVRIVPRQGHTASDISIEVDDPSVVFCGDLVWNAMVPNYVDAIPTKLDAAVRALRRDRETIYVPGHGALARAPEFDRYVVMLEAIGTGARAAHAQGRSAEDAAAAFALPASLGEWALFSPTFFARAFAAWYRELGA
ncbi:MAG: MBL fold metallo-hydrolase [Gemmatimonadota bacterium]|nr:MBL fold metallo-hydrolase [Gemmatimonadota bacterium]MDH5196549.1 MBL fold metallo-hydrolase [Gemmatimonadota bacterium]